MTVSEDEIGPKRAWRLRFSLADLAPLANRSKAVTRMETEDLTRENFRKEGMQGAAK